MGGWQQGEGGKEMETMKSIESNKPLPESSVWSLQDHFYSGTGPDAWKEDIVPQGTTANAYLADVYAGIAAAYCRDLAKQGAGPPLILEVGGGSGRFAWLFLNRLMNHHLVHEEEALPFNYLLTDAAESNVVNWQGKKRFRKLVDSGVLDFGVLRVGESLCIETRPERLIGKPGAVLLHQIMERTRIIAWLAERLHDPARPMESVGGT